MDRPLDASVQECPLAKWSEQGDRYEWLVNPKTGEGYIDFTTSAERTAIPKNCRPSDK